MKFKENERGGALLMVLMLVVVFTVLGMGLMTMNISASKQFDKKEEQVQARHFAEMGLLHYKSKINNEVKNYHFTIKKNETKEAGLIRSRDELCKIILEINEPEVANKYKTENNSCEIGFEDEFIIKISSEGTSKDTTKKIIGTATFSSPTIKDNGGVPEKPEGPPGYDPETDLPDSTEDYVEVNGPVKTKQEEHYYSGSLVINKAENQNPGNGNNAINTFDVGGGKKDRLYVGKDLYIGGNLHIQNHACIIVGGNLTILGPSNIGTQTTIIVYGNAHFEKKPDYKSNQSQIYVVGSAWIGDPAKIFTGFNTSFNFPTDCPKPAGWPDPSSPNYQWKLEDELNPIYDPIDE